MGGEEFMLSSQLYPSQPPNSSIARPRLPLTTSTGNIQFSNSSAPSAYDGRKETRPLPPPNFTLPTLPSQPAREFPLRTPLEARRAYVRSQRLSRLSKVRPILECEAYKAYRARQPTKDSGKNQIWPDELEDLFLEALCMIPQMGQRKFIVNGKQRGRNELILLYMEMGIRTNPRISEERRNDLIRGFVRKKISSHIQTIKGYLQGHPACESIFPSRDKVKKIGDSFKNDPCLLALAQGRLPNVNFVAAVNRREGSPTSPGSPSYPVRSRYPRRHGHANMGSEEFRPSLFRLYMTQLQPGVDYKDVPEDDPGDGTFITKVHTYSDSMPQALARSGLESIPAWDTMFPALARLSHRSDLNIDIIHVEASLELRYGPLPDRSELWGKLEIVVPGRYDEKATWQCVQTMRKPLDLYGPSNIDPPYEEVVSTPQFLRHDPLEGTSLRVSVPASSWAFALQRLSMMEAQFREAERSGTVMPVRTTARQYIEQITMYQEIFCSDGPGEPFILKAILLWTFRKCQSGEEAKATWRYVTPAPARSECFSPHPGSDHIVSAVRNENFGAWANHLSSPIRLGSAPAPFDSMSTLDDYLEPGTAPASAGVHFSFDSYGNPLTSNASFMSHTTQHSGSTLVDDGTHSSYPLDGFLSHESAMGSFENPHQMWDASLMESYDPVPRLSTPYGPAQTSSLRQPWDVPISKPSDWPSDLANVAHSDMNLSLHNLATAARSINML